MSIGQWIAAYGWLVVVATVLGALGMRRALQNSAVRLRWDTSSLKLPLLGEVIAKVQTARFMRTLSSLRESGVSLPQAMMIATETVSNRVITKALSRATEAVRAGEGLAAPLATITALPPIAAQMIHVGEESGALDAMLAHVAETLETEVARTLKRVLALLEPALIVGLGVVIGMLILSILAALLSVNELAF